RLGRDDAQRIGKDAGGESDDGKARIGCGRTGGWRRLHGEGEYVLARVVNGDILVRLEEAQFADALGADAAGGEVGDTAILELKADIGDVDFIGEDGKTDGADFA